jgi:hypothetical protein
MPNISDQFASELMAHSIDLGRFESHEREVLLKVFRDLEAQLIAQLKRVDPTEPSLSVYQRQRAENLLAYVRPIVAQAYREMYFTSRRELQALAVTEATLVHDLGAELVVESLFSVGVPEATLKAMVSDLVLEGRPLRQWWSRQAQTTLSRYGDAVRAGILRGDSINDIVKVLRGTRERRFEDGVFGRSRRDVSTLVRTSVQSISQHARLAVLEANSDVVKGWEWLTALDAVVCFVGSTPVLTPQGYRPIQEIQVGDKVIGGSRKIRKVLATSKRWTTRLAKVRLSNGEMVYCTPDHQWLTHNGEWVEAKDLKSGEKLAEILDEMV